MDIIENLNNWPDRPEGARILCQEAAKEIIRLRITLAETLVSHGYPKESLEPELQAVLEK